MLEKEEIISPNLEELKSHYRSIITLLGEDAEREGLLKTPERVAKAMLSLTKGYHMDPHEVLRSAKFQEEYSQMVIVKDIDFFSLCEHHMLLFHGKGTERTSRCCQNHLMHRVVHFQTLENSRMLRIYR